MAIEGRIDGIRESAVSGWAHDPDRPGERVELEVFLDGEHVGHCVANRERADLRNHGIGDGHHAFRLALRRQLEPGSAHVIVVRSARDGTLLPLAAAYEASASPDPSAPPLILAVDEKDLPVTAFDGADADPATVAVDPSAPAAQGPSPAIEWAPPLAAGQRSLLGTGGWLFPFESFLALQRELGTWPVTPDQAASQSDVLQARAQRLEQLGVSYLVVIAPSKAAVYHEHLPAGLSFDPESRPAAALARVLRDDPGLEALDLFGALRDARRHGRVFLRQGGALTWTGAFHAYRAALKELTKRVPALGVTPATLELGLLADSTDPLSARERVTILGGDILTVTAADEPPEREPGLAGGERQAAYVPVPDELAAHLGPDSAVLEHAGQEDLPSAFVVHDASAERLLPFLAEHFSRTVVEVSNVLPYAAIEQVAPIVVIQVLSEANPFFA